MGDGGGTETGLIGEDAAGNTLLHGDKRSAYHTAGHSGGIERTPEDGGESGGQVFPVDDDNTETQHDIQQCHQGDHTLRHMADALDAAQQDQTDQNGDDDAEDEIEGGGAAGFHCAKADEGGINGGDDGIDLGGIAGAEYRKDAEDGEDDA